MPGDRVRIDFMEFRTLQAEARARHAAGEDLPALSLLKSAIGLWRGPVLSGSACRVWEPEIRRLEEEYYALREQCSDLQLRLGLHEDVITELFPFVAQHPLLERPRAQLMRALAESGRQADALQLYQDTAELLDRELGVMPGEDLRHAFQLVLTGDGNLRGVSVHETVRRRPTEAVPAQSHGSESAAPLPTTTVAASASLGEFARVPSQLPGDIEEFVGREEAVSFLRSALVPHSTTAPVVVVVGPGGTGKSALAVHAAHQLREVFTDGQLYVNLGGMSTTPVSAHEVAGRFLRELGLSGPAIPDSPDERAALLRSRLAGRRMLLLLDNAEDARQITLLLPGTGSCAVLVTSRMRLTTVPNVRILELGVLEPGQAGRLLGRLVGEERLAAEPHVVRELVDYCGGLPLAVRIVAAKLASRPHWPLRRAAARLADERRRLDELTHEGLEVRSTLELSHQGLSPQARRLFRRLALLGSADFAEWVCAPLLGDALLEAEDALGELLDARLVDVVSPAESTNVRFRLHDLVRLFAAECLAESEPSEERCSALRRATATALALADLAHREVCGGDFTVVHALDVRPTAAADVVGYAGADPLGWYEENRSLLSALCVRAAEHDHDELAWDLAATARCLFSVRFHFDDWQRTHEVALAAVRRQANHRGEAALLLGLGDLHLTRRSYDVATPLLERSAWLFAEVGERHGHALALRKVASADRILGHTKRALAQWRECLPALADAGDLEAQTQVLRWISQTHLELGAYDESEAALRDAERMTESFRGRSAGQVRLARADLAAARGDLTLALELYTSALEATTDLGDLSGSCAAMLGLGTVDVRAGRTAQGREGLQTARTMAREIQDPLLELEVLLSLAAAHRAEDHPAQAEALLKEGAALCQRIGARTRLARFDGALAELSAH
ncbi:BTAD domain-containing putative transcriptional regulator [Streptomyces sp. SCSIO 30461]|uniref:BTAD domain-containing putative transcriptional regulator n=1 Tax=Streptomyces sp. SCSIO 30461 TaxID=3118085 RepID=UPI0030CEBE57